MLKKYKIVVIALIFSISAGNTLFAQSIYQPYSFQFYQKFSDDLYSTDTRIHSAIKPYFADDSLLKHTYDSLMNIGVNAGGKSWGARKLFNEHLIDEKQPGFTFYGDLLPDFDIGRDFSSQTTLFTTSLGAQVGGTIGSKFSFYGSVYANREQFPAYITDDINYTYYIPGEGKDLNPGQNVKEWWYTTFLLSYTPAKFVNFTLGKDKTFIGDGYRSMLLSDFASNYPFLKTTVTLGNVRYMAMYAYMDNPNAPKAADGTTRNKWAYFQYLDWNISNRVSIGLFENVMSATEDINGQKRGFNYALASPFEFYVPVVDGENDPDKNLLGFTGKYKVFNKTIIYGQFALDEFEAKNFFSNDGSYTNKYGEQLGIRGADLFHVKGLNYLFEYNTARPYTYASFDQTSNYTQDDQSLADPFVSNFREWLGILNYSAGRFDFQGELDYAYFGLDLNGQDYGQNIFEPYPDAVKQLGNYVGQGLKTDFYYASGKISYLLNPKYNLRLELGAVYRDERNSVADSKSPMITFGLRSSFKDIYNDF